MDFRRSWSLTLEPAAARDLATDEAGRTAAFVRDGARHVGVTVRGRDGATLVRIERDIPTGADAAGTVVVGRFLHAVQTELWEPVDADGAVSAGLHVAFPGRPIAVRARLDLHRTVAGWRQTVTGRATVRVPGIGRPIERKVVAGLLAAMDDQWGAALTA